jgi:hypothetical protein
MLLILVAATLSVFAKADPACEQLITDMNKLEKSYLNPASKIDKTSVNAVKEAITDNLDRFEEIPATDPCRLRAWTAFVNLAQAEAIYDEGANAASNILSKLDDKELNAAYFAALKKDCRGEYLRTKIEEIVCISKAEGDGKGVVGEKA